MRVFPNLSTTFALSGYMVDTRTNNHVKSNNARLLRYADVHGPMWNLISILLNSAKDALANFYAHQNGVRNILSVPSRDTVLNKKRVIDA